MEMEEIHCILCGSGSALPVFMKESASGTPFRLVRCRRCGLRYLSPRPGPEEIAAYYGIGYFSNRTDRGYDDYFSEKIRAEVTRVLEMNLRDLGHDEFERSLGMEKRCLDIGCAAGYSVARLRDRGWRSMGIDISDECAEIARNNGLEVTTGDYLVSDLGGGFDLITLWASLEHLHRPDKILEKAHADLHDGGRIYISTCRVGGVNFMKLFGARWRYYNFPEHLYFFSRKTLGSLLKAKGFAVVSYASYGSGLGQPGGRLRKAADFAASRFGWGDMMILAAEKRG